MKGFRSVGWVAAVGGAALGCYMVSLQVATERADLADVEAQILAARQDIRALETELGTRGRLSQLEHWNAEVLALSAPSSAQFVDSAFTLARLEQREPTLDQRVADIRLASAETQAPSSSAAPAPAAPVVRAVAPASEPAEPALVRRAGLVSLPAEPAAIEPKKPAVAPVARAAPKPAAPKTGLDAALAAEIGALAEDSEGSGGN